mmetsp:Transcript_4978/g.6842  ORF Transcript_4978/g.6842 Transcript_4978/m.6842 type:complete len:388 (+) Transcript_4978:181-1344(+)|eukprot:CAMPEP_0117741340 /NCGR_PEP_ID=MMETSP0947-20121206/4856_1 /TAXON_ID=44440 /ORGANISM="Chattonella subsalsa, Strain CCMP2191" /LENGTH=387 /DNA_ID=CAMNT_0005557581 /DNA_START=54 /DNA_END=1217 /DNA_ORIENTATION=-
MEMDALAREISLISVYQTPQTLEETKKCSPARKKVPNRKEKRRANRQQPSSALGPFGENVMIYEQQYDPKLELEVLEAISLRESLVATLLAEIQLIREDRPFSLATVLSTALQLRQAAKEILKKVTNWREVLTRPMEFHAGEKNYLLWMLQDISDALRVLPFSKMYRMELGGKNPFLLPYQTKRQIVEPFDSSVKVKTTKVKKEPEFCIPELLNALAHPSEEELKWIKWGQLYLEEEERRYGQKDTFQGGWGYHRWLKSPWTLSDQLKDQSSNGLDSSKAGSQEGPSIEPESKFARTLPSDQGVASSLYSMDASVVLEGYEERFGKNFADKVSNIPSTHVLRKALKEKVEENQNEENEDQNQPKTRAATARSLRKTRIQMHNSTKGT